jgi:hypothetical protein
MNFAAQGILGDAGWVVSNMLATNLSCPASNDQFKLSSDGTMLEGKGTGGSISFTADFFATPMCN